MKKKKYIYIGLVIAVVYGSLLCLRFPDYVWSHQPLDPDREITNYEQLIKKMRKGDTYADVVSVFGNPVKIQAGRTGWGKENINAFYVYNTSDGKQLSFLIAWDGRLMWIEDNQTRVPALIYDRPQ